jgi:hypothetical protein
MPVAYVGTFTHGTQSSSRDDRNRQPKEAVMAEVSQRMTRGEVQDLLAKFAIDNPRYRQALMADPKSVVERQLNTSLGNVKVKAVVETADTVYVVIPHTASEGELSDADLEKVAGGKNDISATCTVSSSGSQNTVTQINY